MLIPVLAPLFDTLFTWPFTFAMHIVHLPCFCTAAGATGAALYHLYLNEQLSVYLRQLTSSYSQSHEVQPRLLLRRLAHIIRMRRWLLPLRALLPAHRRRLHAQHVDLRRRLLRGRDGLPAAQLLFATPREVHLELAEADNLGLRAARGAEVVLLVEVAAAVF